VAVQLSLMPAIEIFDSRTWLATRADGRRVRSRVPFGASVGCREAVELRDQDDNRYARLRVHRTAARVNGPIAELSTSQPFTALEQVDPPLQPPEGPPTNPDWAPARLFVSRWSGTRTWARFSGVPGRRVSWVHMFGSDRWRERVRPARVAPRGVSAVRVWTGNEMPRKPGCFDCQPLNRDEPDANRSAPRLGWLDGYAKVVRER
jgi:Enolase, N-terminal domain